MGPPGTKGGEVRCWWCRGDAFPSYLHSTYLYRSLVEWNCHAEQQVWCPCDFKTYIWKRFGFLVKKWENGYMLMLFDVKWQSHCLNNIFHKFLCQKLKSNTEAIRFQDFSGQKSLLWGKHSGWMKTPIIWLSDCNLYRRHCLKRILSCCFQTTTMSRGDD